MSATRTNLSFGAWAPKHNLRWKCAVVKFETPFLGEKYVGFLQRYFGSMNFRFDLGATLCRQEQVQGLD